MSNIKLTVLVLLLLLFFTAETPAWDLIICGPPMSDFSPYWNAAAVFTGQVESIETREKEIIAKFAVEKVYRGVVGDRVEIATEVRHGYPFVKGEQYFVYSGSVRQDGKQHVDMCSATKVLVNAGEDIEFAEEVAAGKRGTRIHGWVYQYRPKLWTLRNNEPVAGIKVTIKDRTGKEFTTTTDEKGRYVFKEVADGAYEIKAETPAGTHLVGGFRNYGYSELLYIGHVTAEQNFGFRRFGPSYRFWDSRNFMFTSAGSIQGRVVNFADKQMSHGFLELLVLDDNGKSRENYAYAELRANGKPGEFVFGLVAPGKYMIAINPNGCHTRQPPQYGRIFYPGAADENDARIITVRENEVVKLKNFKLPPPLREKWISGVVVLPDGTPVANATVFMGQKVVSISTCVNSSDNVQTDAAGRFRVKGFEPYEYTVGAYIQTGSDTPRKRLISRKVEILQESAPNDLRLTLYPEN